MMRTAIMMAAALALNGCSSLPPSDELKAKWKTPPSAELVAEVQAAVDDSDDYFAKCLSDAAEHGRPLTAEESLTAKDVGVKHPGNVRIVGGATWWKRKPLWWVAGNAGATCGYTVYMAPVGPLKPLRHELTHVAQMERYPSVEAWYVAYHTENQFSGYSMNRFEAEAVANSQMPL